jgi:hypothetical protein
MMESWFKCFENPFLIGEVFLKAQELVDMAAGEGFNSENARNVILRHNDKLYYVNRVSVHFREDEKTHRAVFHARRAIDNKTEDLSIEINQRLYDVLVDYAKLDNYDLILILQIEGNSSKWCLVTENWLKHGASENNAGKYVI